LTSDGPTVKIKIRISHTSFTIRKISNTCLFYFKCRVIHRYTMDNLLKHIKNTTSIILHQFYYVFWNIRYNVVLHHDLQLWCDVCIYWNQSIFWSSFRSLFKNPEIEEEINKTGISNNFKHTLMITGCPPEFRQLFKLKTRMKL